MLVHQTVDDGKTIGEVFCEITALEVGDESISDFFHG